MDWLPSNGHRMKQTLVLTLPGDSNGHHNLIAKKQLMPELIQEDASPSSIAATATRMVSEPEKLGQLEKELLGVRNLLGGAGASDRVAEIAFDLIQQSGKN